MVAKDKSKNKLNEITIIRVYDAPVKTVWKAWVDPAQVAQWWGPRGFTITTHSKDVRSGGHWDYIMHGPDGVDYPNYTHYLEVEEYTRLVYDHGGLRDKPALFRVTVNFTETKGKTRMEMTMALPTPERAEQTRKFIKQAGGDSTWDRLAEYLEKEATGKEKFVIARSFEAPLTVMHEMWTNPKHFMQWLAPTGMTMEFIRAEIKSGGSSFYRMSAANGFRMHGHIEYQEISPTKLVYTQQFCDEHENPARHPMAPTWPQTMLTTVEFTEEGPDRTRVVISWEVFGQATAEEIATFLKERGGMTKGWTGSFDKLEDYLAQQ